MNNVSGFFNRVDFNGAFEKVKDVVVKNLSQVDRKVAIVASSIIAGLTISIFAYKSLFKAKVTSESQGSESEIQDKATAQKPDCSEESVAEKKAKRVNHKVQSHSETEGFRPQDKHIAPDESLDRSENKESADSINSTPSKTPIKGILNRVLNFVKSFFN